MTHLVRKVMRRFNVTLVVLVCLVVISVIQWQQQYSTYLSRPIWYPRLSDSNRSGHACDQCCHPVNNIFLLKTHKCASSTIQNIVMRYGDRRNLSFALPREGNYFGHPKPFNKGMLPLDLVPSFGFNILAHHTRFNSAAIKEVMPPETVFVTILRDPVDLFDSMFAYLHLGNYTGSTIQEFANDENRQSFLRSNRYEKSFGPNQMFFDLGYDVDKMNETSISEAIERIDREFDLVLITEYFNESLVLLKNLFCWDSQDIMYFKHNKRKLGNQLPEDVRQRIRAYNAADQRLYAHFKAKIESLIEAYGQERMKQDVNSLQLWRKLIYEHCVKTMGESDHKELQAYSKDVLSIVLKPEVHDDAEQERMCYDMARAELPYTDRLRRKQKLLAKSAQML